VRGTRAADRLREATRAAGPGACQLVCGLQAAGTLRGSLPRARTPWSAACDDCHEPGGAAALEGRSLVPEQVRTGSGL